MHRLDMFENMVPKATYGSRVGKITGGWEEADYDKHNSIKKCILILRKGKRYSCPCA
jgi:hypothetical protein